MHHRRRRTPLIAATLWTYGLVAAAVPAWASQKPLTMAAKVTPTAASADEAPKPAAKPEPPAKPEPTAKPEPAAKPKTRAERRAERVKRRLGDDPEDGAAPGAVGIVGTGGGGNSRFIAPRVPWRGTGLSWSHSATTTLLGVGQQTISDAHEVYIQQLGATLNYFVFDEDYLRVRVDTQPSFSLELTDSNVTTTYREPQFNDLPLEVVVNIPLYRTAGGWGASGLLGTTAVLPTSKISRRNGTYWTQSSRAGVFQVIPLLGPNAAALRSVMIGASVRWDHRFGRATTPVYSDLRWTRQNAQGQTFLSDQLSFSPIATDTLREGAFLFFTEKLFGSHLWVFAGANLTQSWLPAFEGNDCEAEILTGCVKGESPPNKVTLRRLWGFSGSIIYFPTNEVSVAVGYASATNQLGPDGQLQSIWYTPNATFSASIGLSLDAIYEAFTGPRRNSPFFLAKRDRQRKGDERGRADDDDPRRTAVGRAAMRSRGMFGNTAGVGGVFGDAASGRGGAW